MAPFHSPEDQTRFILYLTKHLWESANTFTDLLRFNAEYIKGNIAMTPFHLGPLDPETEDVIPGLLKLNDLRIFTIGDVSTFVSTIQMVEENQYVENRQRPRVDFVMADADQPMQLFDALKNRKDVKVYGTVLNYISLIH